LSIGSQEICVRKIRKLFYRRELIELQYQALVAGLLVNIDRSEFCRRFCGNPEAARNRGNQSKCEQTSRTAEP